MKAALLEKRMLTQADVSRHLSAAEQRLAALLNGQPLPTPTLPATPVVQARTQFGPPGLKALAPRFPAAMPGQPRPGAPAAPPAPATPPGRQPFSGADRQ